jgi:hypothetical protein
LATAGFEKLTSELEKAGVKTTHTIYAGTMSFGVKDGRIQLAQTPGGLNYLPVNISIKQVITASLTDFIKAILKEHRVIQHHFILPSPERKALCDIAAKLPMDTNTYNTYGQHKLGDIGATGSLIRGNQVTKSNRNLRVWKIG